MRNSISTTHNLVLIWACMACMDHGLDVQTANTQMETSSAANSRTIADVSLSRRHKKDTGWHPRFNALASLLVQLNPSAAYRLTIPGVHSAQRQLLMARRPCCVLPLMSMGEADEQLAATGRASPAGFSRRQILTGGLAAVALLSQSPRAAEASLGSARGAVTSPPGLNSQFKDTDYFEALDPRKQAQVQTLLKPVQIEQLRSDIAVQKDKLQTQIEFVVQGKEQRTEKLRELRARFGSLSKKVAQADVDLNMAQLELNKIEGGTPENKTDMDTALQKDM